MADREKHARTNRKVSQQEFEYQMDELEMKITLLNSQLELKADLLLKSDKKNASLFDENKQLKYEVEVLEREKQKATDRLMNLGVQVESHSSYIAKQWTELYKNEWTYAFKELCQQDPEMKCHRGPEKRLMQATEWCYKKCCDLSENLSEEIKPSLQTIACKLNFQTSTEDSDKNQPNQHVQNTFESLQRFVQQRQLYDAGLFHQLKQNLVDEYTSKNGNVLQNELKFVENCCELCWMMRVSDPPMVIEYSDLEGTEFDVSKFNQYNLEGTKIEFVVWPDLLLHENGPVLTKGIVRTSTEGKKDTQDSNLIYDYPKRKLSVSKGEANGVHIFTNISDAHSGQPAVANSQESKKSSDEEGDYIAMSRPSEPPNASAVPETNGNRKHIPFNRKQHKRTPNSEPSSPTPTLSTNNDTMYCSTENLSKHDKKKNKKKTKETFISYITGIGNNSTI